MADKDNRLDRHSSPDWIGLVPQMVQRQDSTVEQIRDLHRVAVRLGMYDAADALKEHFPAIVPGSGSVL